MDRGTMWGIVAAPIVGPLFWWLVKKPGKWAANYLRQMPDGRIRRLLLRKVSE